MFCPRLIRPLPPQLALSVLAISLASGCPNLDLGREVPDAVIACTGDDDCPAGFVCGENNGLCLRPGGADVDGPIAALISLEPAALGPGVSARLTFEVNEDLAAAPVVSVDPANITATIVEGDHTAGDRRFVLSFVVPDAADLPAAISVSLRLVDRADNASTEVLGPFAIDVEGPAFEVVASVGDKAAATNGDTLTVSVDLDGGDTLRSGVVKSSGGETLSTLSIVGAGFVPLVLAGLPDGESLVVEVSAEDAVGNVAVVLSNSIPIDTSPPDVEADDVALADDNGTAIAGAVVPEAFSVVVTADDDTDVDTVCVRAAVGSIADDGDCGDDADFVDADDAIDVVATAGTGPLVLEVLTRDEAGNEALLRVPLVVLVGDAASVALSAHAGQTAIKTNDTVTVSGVTLAGAAVSVLLVDGSGAAVSSTVDVVADSAGAYAAATVVAAGAADGSVVSARVTVSVVVDGVTIALPAVDSAATLPVDLVGPTVSLSTASTTVASPQVTVDFDIAGAATAVVSGDIVSAEAIAGLDEAGSNLGSIAVELSPGDGDKDVVVDVRDGAGNSASASLRFTLDSSIPSVALLMRNADRAVDGVGPNSSIEFSGSSSAGTVVSGRLFFVDNVDAEILACEKTVAFVLSDNGAAFDISTAAPVAVGPCAGAARVGAELIVEDVLARQSVAALSRGRLDTNNDGVADVGGSDFYFDDQAPVPAPLVVDFDRSAPPGRDAITIDRAGVAVVVTPTQNVTLVLEADDEHPMTATVAGASPVASASVVLAGGVPSAPQAFVVGGVDGDKTISVTVEDEVGNVASPQDTLIVLDTTPPAAPVLGNVVYREDNDDRGGDDDLSLFVVAGVAGAVEADARVFVFAPGDDAALDVAAVSAVAIGDGSFADADISALGAPVVDVDLVAVDAAGHRSVAQAITRPRFSLAPSVAVMGTRPAVVVATVADLAALDAAPDVSLENADGTVPSADAGDVTVVENGADFTVTFALDADDGVTEGPDSVVSVVSGRGPGLHPSSLSFDGVRLSADFTPPQINVAALRVLESAADDDTVSGLAGAVSDRAGASVNSVAGLSVNVSGVGVDVDAVANADGSFGPVSVGATRPDAMSVVVVEDAAGNVGVAVNISAPTLDNVVIGASAIAGDVVSGSVDAAGLSGLNDSFTVRLGASDGVIDAVEPGASVSVVRFSISTDGADRGPQALTVTATSDLGLSTTLVVTDAVELLPPPPGLSVNTAPPATSTTTVIAYDVESDDAGATLVCGVSGGAEIPCAFTGPVRLPLGTSTLTLTAVSAEGARSAPLSFDVTVTAPLQVASSGGTTCALRQADGALFCWGDNRDGHLTDIATRGFVGPQRVFAAVTWRSVAVGGDAVCGGTDAGLQCFGSTRRDLLPSELVAANDMITAPTPIAEIPVASGLAMNEQRGCALNGLGQLLCWGEPLSVRAPGALFDVFEVGVTDGVVGVGERHACVVDDEAAVCVGDNSHGQLGDSVAIGASSNTPVIAIDLGAPIAELSVSGARTCVRAQGLAPAVCVGDNNGAISSATLDLVTAPAARVDASATAVAVSTLGTELLSMSSAGERSCGVDRDGVLRCQGTQAFGASGDGGVVDPVARALRSFGAPGDTFDVVRAFAGATCAIRSNDGALLCAGDTFDIVASGRVTADVIDVGGSADSLGGGARSLCATVGGQHVCAGNGDDNAFFAGDVDGAACAASCELGSVCDNNVCIGDVSFAVGDGAVVVRAAAVADAYAAGVGGACGVVAGEVQCAGQSSSRLGRGTIRNQQQADPARVPLRAPVTTIDDGGALPLLAADARIAVGNDTACVVGVLNDNNGSSVVDGLACWGEHTATGARAVAAFDAAAAPALDVAVGDAHGCVVHQGAVDLEVLCFGDNTLGARGDNDVGGTFSTVVQQGGTPIVARAAAAGIAASGHSSCALLDPVGVACWGDNAAGVVSPDNRALASSPVAVPQTAAPFDTAFDVVAVGPQSACAGRDDALVCWGRPMLPLAELAAAGDDSPIIIPVIGAQWRRLVVGDGFACGLTVGGDVHCVGAQVAGVFADGQGIAESAIEVVLP